MGTEGPAPNTGWRVMSTVCALLGAGVAGYLGLIALLRDAAPPGCGSGSGCGEVLGSKWSSLFGLPVSLGAVAVYLSLAVCVRRPGRTSDRAAAGLAGLALGSAAWFVYLQFAVLKAVCPWCMADHALGTLAALAALRATGRLPSALTGLALAALLAVIQALAPAPVHSLDLPTGRNFDLTQNGIRVAGLMDGRFTFQIADEPHLGDPAAERLVFLSVDYACPHCRHLHALARDLAESRPGEFCAVILPTPIHPDCNPAMTSVPDRFNESCELAALSLAVFHADPAAWPAFDAWLFEPERPRSLAEALKRAAPLLEGRPEAEEAAARDVKRNVDLFTALPLEDDAHRRVPVTLWVHQPPVIGPIDDPDLLWTRAAPPVSDPEPQPDAP